MDEWDDVVMLEQHAYAAGQSDAQSDVPIHEVTVSAKSEGFKAGLLKGCAIGFELGFFSSVPNDNRGKKLIDELHAKVKDCPRSNAQAEASGYDYDSSIRSMRSLYRASGSLLGKFPPNPSNGDENEKVETMDW